MEVVQFKLNIILLCKKFLSASAVCCCWYASLGHASNKVAFFFVMYYDLWNDAYYGFFDLIIHSFVFISFRSPPFFTFHRLSIVSTTSVIDAYSKYFRVPGWAGQSKAWRLFCPRLSMLKKIPGSKSKNYDHQQLLYSPFFCKFFLRTSKTYFFLYVTFLRITF